ncbi:CinA family protein [Limimaricola cinnabarinus]|jgi:nicotinamide-nucleotide amidase|uniref:Damage-inducible protein CinA n=1 Tax=Limimaricola cinnabarinus TaxID=1125964 RepID=A0A2G1MJU4_9RHOB|nr:CinA family protein [Limimaricola cinnabarinus]PHP29026.1 damage-inducible protein CinA [Limimaricola cinnabarinus]
MGDTARLVNAARAAGLRVATAESCTGGMLAAAITETPGASNVFDWGVVTYSNAAKQALLGVSPATLDAHGAVSVEVAAEMAQGALSASGADIAISITGIAGPGASEYKPEGRVCFGVATAQGCKTELVEFGARGRDTVRALARDHAIAAVIDAITRQDG